MCSVSWLYAVQDDGQAKAHGATLGLASFIGLAWLRKRLSLDLISVSVLAGLMGQTLG